MLELTFQLGEVNMDLLEMKQKMFERTSGNLEPRLLQKMARSIPVNSALNDSPTRFSTSTVSHFSKLPGPLANRVKYFSFRFRFRQGI